jgi:hypothetical protein
MKGLTCYLSLFHFSVFPLCHTCTEKLLFRSGIGTYYHNTEIDQVSLNLHIGICITLYCSDDCFSMCAAINLDISDISPLFPRACAFRPFYHRTFPL